MIAPAQVLEMCRVLLLRQNVEGAMALQEATASTLAHMAASVKTLPPRPEYAAEGAAREAEELGLSPPSMEPVLTPPTPVPTIVAAAVQDEASWKLNLTARSLSKT